ncbi:MAG TPA: hypothetical protein VGC84_09930, partial [Ilumatobacteraceae bacterium]
RRRNAALVALATLLVGLIVGIVAGRSTAITASEAARDVRAKGDTLGTRIEALTIEYEQAIAGTGDTVQAGVLDALDLVDADIDKLIVRSPWLGKAQIQSLHDATKAVRTAAESRVSPDDFSQVAANTATLIRDTFGA